MLSLFRNKLYINKYSKYSKNGNTNDKAYFCKILILNKRRGLKVVVKKRNNTLSVEKDV